MYVSRAHHGPHVPHSLVPLILGILAVAGTVLAWAAFNARPLSTDSKVAIHDPIAASQVRAIAYSVPGAGVDNIYVRALGPGSEPALIATFPYVYGLHARGSASPRADTIAVLSVSSDPTYAQMALLDVAGRTSMPVAAEFDYLSTLAWSQDGWRVTGVQSGPADSSARVAAAVIEVDVRTGQATPVARFEGVFEAAPVGYSPGGDRLYVVTVNQSGSTLWVVKEGATEKVGVLSAGRTRDWALSPDGARLAYIDIRAGSDRAYTGRTMLLATGAITEQPADGDQIGVAWLPGSEIPAFGGPGGSVRLTGADEQEAYVVPVRWSPDGTVLAARVFSPGDREGRTGVSETLEITTAESRLFLTDRAGAWAFGFVIDAD